MNVFANFNEFWSTFVGVVVKNISAYFIIIITEYI